MSIQITTFRNLHMSMHLYIKDTVLRNWYPQELNAAVTYDQDYGLYMPDYEGMGLEPLPNGRGRGWVYFDYPDLQNEQTNQQKLVPGT